MSEETLPFDTESMEEVLPTLEQVVGRSSAFEILRDKWVPQLIAEVKRLQKPQEPESR